MNRAFLVGSLCAALLLGTGCSLYGARLASSPAIAVFGLACSLTLSALCCGLTTGLLSLGRGELEAQAAYENSAARAVLALRRDTNGLVSTLVCANVSFNLAADEFVELILAGRLEWLKLPISVVLIVFLCELLPIAFLTRHGLAVGGLLAPAVHLLKFVFWPAAKPATMILNSVLGPEELAALSERTLTWLLERQRDIAGAEVTAVEARVAANVLKSDDTPLTEIAHPVNPNTIVEVAVDGGMPSFVFRPGCPESDELLSRLLEAGQKWVVLTQNGQSRWIVDADDLARKLLAGHAVLLKSLCRTPMVITNPNATLEDALLSFQVEAEHPDDVVVDVDVVIVEIPETTPLIVTGADILGHLLRGVPNVVPCTAAQL